MKIRFGREEKRYIPKEDYEAVQMMLDTLKLEDVNEYVDDAVRIGTGYSDRVEVLKADACVAKNPCVWNAFGETKNYDVHFNIICFANACKFFRIGVYLTDLWRDKIEEVKTHMHIEIYNRIW